MRWYSSDQRRRLLGCLGKGSWGDSLDPSLQWWWYSHGWSLVKVFYSYLLLCMALLNGPQVHLCWQNNLVRDISNTPRSLSEHLIKHSSSNQHTPSCECSTHVMVIPPQWQLSLKRRRKVPGSLSLNKAFSLSWLKKTIIYLHIMKIFVLYKSVHLTHALSTLFYNAEVR